MTPPKARLVFCAIVALFAGVIGNALHDQGARPARYAAPAVQTDDESTPAIASASAAAEMPGEQPTDAGAGREQTLARVAKSGAISETPTAFAESNRTTSRIGTLADRLLTHSLNAEDPETTSPELVRAIQRELLQRGYAPGTPDGVAGIVTRAAIMAFEHDAGLRLTGTASEQLLKQLILGPSPGHGIAAITSEPSELARDIIAHVQMQLSQLGYAAGASSGMVSPPTAAAIRGFEHDGGLTTTGRISGRLVAALARRTGKGFTLARRDTAPL